MARNEIGPRDRYELSRRLQYILVGSVGRQFGVEQIDAIGRDIEGIRELARQAPDRIQQRRIGLRQARLRRSARLSGPRQRGLDLGGRCIRIESQEAEWPG